MMTDSYEDIADRSWDEIPEEKTLPGGSWLLRGRSASYKPAKDDNSSPAILFIHTAKEPMDDVDDEELQALGADYDIGQNRIFTRFYLETGRDYKRVRDFLEVHGVEIDPKKSIKETLPAFKGTQAIAVLTSRSFTRNDGTTAEENVASQFTKVE